MHQTDGTTLTTIVRTHTPRKKLCVSAIWMRQQCRPQTNLQVNKLVIILSAVYISGFKNSLSVSFGTKNVSIKPPETRVLTPPQRLKINVKAVLLFQEVAW